MILLFAVVALLTVGIDGFLGILPVATDGISKVLDYTTGSIQFIYALFGRGANIPSFFAPFLSAILVIGVFALIIKVMPFIG